MTTRLTTAKRKKRFIPRLAYGCVGLGLSVVPGMLPLTGCGSSGDAATKDPITDAVYPCLCDFDSGVDSDSGIQDATTDGIAVRAFPLDANSDAGADASDAGDTDAEADAETDAAL